MSDGRRWLELRVRPCTGEEHGDLLADALIVLGARGVVERDGWYLAYFEEPDDPERFVRLAGETLAAETGLDGLRLEHGWQEHEEWAESWKRGLGPRRVTSRIVVHPSWSPPDDIGPGDVVIELDPGMAFGTAEHATTRGCLRLLDRCVSEGDRLLEVGAGSGILSLAAAGLGASEVIAVEGDPYACEAMTENLERNAMADRVRIVEAWETAESLAARGSFDGVVANLESGLLVPLAPGLCAAVADGGWLVVSGILDHEWDRLVTALAGHDFSAIDVDEDGEWRSGRFERFDH